MEPEILDSFLISSSKLMKVFNRLEALLSKQSACSQDSHVHQPLMTLVCLNLRLWVWHKQLRTDQNPSSSFLLLPHLISAGSVSSNLVSTFSSSFICELIKNIPPYYYCKGVCKAYATSLRMITLILLRLCVCVSGLLTSQVSQRPQQASVVMCSAPQPGFLARKANSRTAQPTKRRRLAATVWRA